jgi:hypothetical protein
MFLKYRKNTSTDLNKNEEPSMAKVIVDAYRKAVLDSGIAGKDWRKNEAFDDFTKFFNSKYSEVELKGMKYDDILKVSKAWWEEHRSKYS